jgi:hypothetical protein
MLLKNSKPAERVFMRLSWPHAALPLRPVYTPPVCLPAQDNSEYRAAAGIFQDNTPHLRISGALMARTGIFLTNIQSIAGGNPVLTPADNRPNIGKHYKDLEKTT